MTFQDPYRCGWGNRTHGKLTLTAEEGGATFGDLASSFDREMLEIMGDRRLQEQEKARKYDKIRRGGNHLLQRKQEYMGESKTDVYTSSEEWVGEKGGAKLEIKG